MSSNLRLLLDENVTNVLADQLRQEYSSLNIEYCRELPIKGGSDPEVMRYAQRERRIVVTTETAFNDKQYPVCTHLGIIVLGGKRRHDAIHAGHFRAFMWSGHRIETKNAVTFITDREMRVKSHDGTKTIPLR